MSTGRESPADEEELLQRASRADKAAFDQLFQRSAAALNKAISCQLSPQIRRRIDVNDVMQETYAVAFRRLPEFMENRPMAFWLWLRQLARDQVIMAHRKHVHAEKRSVQKEIKLPDASSFNLGKALVASTSSPSKRLRRKELVERVHEAIGSLKESEREIVTMVYFEGLTCAEIAQLLGIEAAAARQRFSRANRRLRDLLTSDGDALS